MNEEEWYLEYQSKLRQLEVEQETFARKSQMLEDDMAMIREKHLSHRTHMENLLNSWGECQDSGVLLADFEEAQEEEVREMKKQEEELQEERYRLKKDQAACESWYDEGRKRLQEEESCQEEG